MMSSKDKRTKKKLEYYEPSATQGQVHKSLKKGNIALFNVNHNFAEPVFVYVAVFSPTAGRCKNLPVALFELQVCSLFKPITAWLQVRVLPGEPMKTLPPLQWFFYFSA